MQKALDVGLEIGWLELENDQPQPENDQPLPGKQTTMCIGEERREEKRREEETPPLSVNLLEQPGTTGGASPLAGNGNRPIAPARTPANTGEHRRTPLERWLAFKGHVYPQESRDEAAKFLGGLTPERAEACVSYSIRGNYKNLCEPQSAIKPNATAPPRPAQRLPDATKPVRPSDWLPDDVLAAKRERRAAINKALKATVQNGKQHTPANPEAEIPNGNHG
jgi:hypothetical protein